MDKEDVDVHNLSVNDLDLDHRHNTEVKNDIKQNFSEKYNRKIDTNK